MELWTARLYMNRSFTKPVIMPTRNFRTRTSCSSDSMNWPEQGRGDTDKDKKEPFASIYGWENQTKPWRNASFLDARKPRVLWEKKKTTKRSRNHSPSFESVLALAPNEAAAKNSATTPMAAAAMPAASAAPLPSYVLPLLLLLPLPSQLHHSSAGSRNKTNFYMSKKVSFFVPLFLYVCALRCQRARMDEWEKGC